MTLLRQLLRVVLQFAAGFVIVLALLVGVLRLVLPEAATLTDEIKTAVKDATGFTIDFRFISAGVSHHGPELRFLDVTLSWPDGEQIVAADKLVVSASVGAALFDKKLLPSRVLVEGSGVSAVITAAGELNLQGRSWRELLPPEQDEAPAEIPDMSLQFSNITFDFSDTRRNTPAVAGFVRSFEADFEDELIEVSAEVLPGELLGRTLTVEAEIPLRLLLADEDVAIDRAWNLAAEIEDLRLDAWLRLLDAPELPVMGSEGSMEVSVEFRGLKVQDSLIDVDLQNVLLAQPDAEPVIFDWVEGRFIWRLASGGWLAGGSDIRLSRNDQVWPQSNYSLRYVSGSEPGTERYIAAADFMRLDDLMPVVRSVATQGLADAGITGELRGDLTALSVELALRDKKLADFSIESGFAALGYVDTDKGLELSGYSGDLKAGLDGGDLRLRTRGAQFGVEQFFSNTFDITSLQGTAVWRRTDDGYRILANGIELETPHGSASVSMELLTDPEFRAPVVDINGSANMADATNISTYLPKVLPLDVVDWVDRSVIAGRVPNAKLVLSGPLNAFPFLQDEGEFLVRVDVVDAVLDYAPDWPILNDIAGEIVFVNESLYSHENTLTVSGMQANNIAVRVDDLREGVLAVSGGGALRIADVVTFMQASPLREQLGPVLDDVQAEGETNMQLSLVLPIMDTDAWQLDGEFSTRDATIALAGLQPELTGFTSSGSIRNTQITIPAATANLLGEPVSIAVRPATAAEADISHRADISGNIRVRPLWAAFDLPDAQFYDGITAFTARALFPLVEEAADVIAEPFRLQVETELIGVSIAIPYPLIKAPEQADMLQAEWRFPDDGVIDFSGSLQRGFNWVMRLEEGADGFEIERALVTPDPPPLVLPDEPGVKVAGYIDTLVFDDWVEAYDTDEEEISDWEQMFSLIDIQVGEFYGADYRFVDVDIRARPMETAWDVRVAGPWIEGQLKVPFNLTGPESLTMDMQRLLMIEPLDVEAEDPVDPREMPTLKGRVSDFAIDAQRYGALEVELERTPNGLRSVTLRSESDSFDIEASADWEVIDNAQRTRLHAELTSTDMAQTLIALDYDAYMTAKQGKVIADLLWEGPPGMAMVYESTGTVSMNVRDGVIYEVDPGGARLLGLLSVAAIPRRLTLDFSEMTADGLPFDTLGGTFQIDFGNAFTCDLGLEGEITDMGVVGRTGILAEDYDQIAAVRPHVSNLAPVAGAFLAGPVVGVATLLITQIFKKPLSGVGGSYYTITGSWDDPVIEPADRKDLDLTAFSACEQDLPEMSPEGVKALQDLLQERQPEAVVLPEGLFPAKDQPEPEQPADEIYDDDD